MTQPAVKTALESALVAAIVGLACLWMLISGAQAEDVSNARMTFLALGLTVSILVHLTYMAIALKRAGRSAVLWMVAMVCLPVAGSVVAAVLITSQEEPAGSS